MSDNFAICYDFDRTLTPDDMQAQGFIQDLGMTPAQFWAATGDFADKQGVDSNLAYMYLMAHLSKKQGRPLTKELLYDYGAKVVLYQGAEEWFGKLTAFAAGYGISLKHFIISSGLKEMIQGCAIGNKFTKIYASSFVYDSSGAAVWPAQVVNYTNKTQFLFRVSKGVLNERDESVNERMSSYAVPFTNIIYIGDSATDIPCMKLVTQYGGYSAGVYDPESGDTKRMEKMLADGRIGGYFAADYRQGSPLDVKVRAIIANSASETEN